MEPSLKEVSHILKDTFNFVEKRLCMYVCTYMQIYIFIDKENERWY